MTLKPQSSRLSLWARLPRADGLISALSKIPILTSEVATSDDTSSIKDDTTVALDFGRFGMPATEDDPAIQLFLFGTPGQDRFDFRWESRPKVPVLPPPLPTCVPTSPRRWSTAKAFKKRSYNGQKVRLSSMLSENAWASYSFLMPRQTWP